MPVSKPLLVAMKRSSFATVSPLLFAVLLPTVLHSQESQGGATSAPQPGQLAPPPDANGLLKLPNTVSAPPLTAAEKFDYRVVQTFGIRGFVGAGIIAGFGQASNTPYSWGGGMEGFAKRYASNFAGNLSRQAFAYVLEEGLRQDPRYFPSRDPGFKLRVTNSVKQVFVTQTDSGHASFAYARIGSAFAAGQFVNVWQPASTGSVGDGLKRGVFSLGGDLAFNLMQEFFPFTRPSSMRNRH